MAIFTCLRCTVQISSFLLLICHRGYPEIWTGKRLGIEYMEDYQMRTMVERRIRSGSLLEGA